MACRVSTKQIKGIKGKVLIPSGESRGLFVMKCKEISLVNKFRLAFLRSHKM